VDFKDDDEIYPKTLMEEIISLEPTEEFYSIPWLQIKGDNAELTYNPYYVRNLTVLRLFKNIPEMVWSGCYGIETIAYNKKRIPRKSCKQLVEPFLHIGEYRKRFPDSKHNYDYYDGSRGDPGDKLCLPLSDRFKKYVKGIKKPNVSK